MSIIWICGRSLKILNWPYGNSRTISANRVERSLTLSLWKATTLPHGEKAVAPSLRTVRCSAVSAIAAKVRNSEHNTSKNGK